MTERKGAEREGGVIAVIPCKSTLQLFDIRKGEKIRWVGSTRVWL